MSGASSQPPGWSNPSQPGSRPNGDEATESVHALPAAPQPLALPAPHLQELALPPAPTPTALPPAPTPAALLPAPANLELPRPAPPGAPSRAPSPKGHRWAAGILAAGATLLVICALPLWAFGLWTLWSSNNHLPPPIMATLNPGGQRADVARWSPDGRFLAEQITLDGAAPGDPNGVAVVLWDVAARREVRSFTGKDGGLAVAWSPDGSWLATTDGTHALIWSAQQIETPGMNVTPASLPAHDPNQQITDLAWAKDGHTLAVADEGGLDIWSQVDTNWKQQQYFTDGPCAAIPCGRQLSWSPDGRWLLVAPWHDAKTSLSGVGAWDTQSWQQASLLDASAPLAWSPDGSLALVRASDETTLAAVRAGSWSVAWTINPNLDLHQSYNVFPQAAGWSPDGRWLVGSADGWVDLWPTSTRQSAMIWNAQQKDQGIYAVNSLAWSPNSQMLAEATDGTALLTLYDLRNP